MLDSRAEGDRLVARGTGIALAGTIPARIQSEKGHGHNRPHHRDLAGHPRRYRTPRRPLRQARDRFDKLEIRFDKLETRFDRLESKVDRLESRFDRVEAKVIEHDARFDSVDQRLDAVRAAVQRCVTREEFAMTMRLNDERYERMHALIIENQARSTAAHQELQDTVHQILATLGQHARWRRIDRAERVF